MAWSGRMMAGHRGRAPRSATRRRASPDTSQDRQLAHRWSLSAQRQGQPQISALVVLHTLSASWPGLSRPSTALMLHDFQDVDAHDKRGYDESRILSIGRRAR